MWKIMWHDGKHAPAVVDDEDAELRVDGHVFVDVGDTLQHASHVTHITLRLSRH